MKKAVLAGILGLAPVLGLPSILGSGLAGSALAQQGAPAPSAPVTGAPVMGATPMMRGSPTGEPETPRIPEAIGTIPFSPDQEAILRRDVAQHGASSPALPERQAAGAKLPEGIALHAFTQPVHLDVPLVRSYRYVRTPGGIALVDPATRMVIRVIDGP